MIYLPRREFVVAGDVLPPLSYPLPYRHQNRPNVEPYTDSFFGQPKFDLSFLVDIQGCVVMLSS
jgi:hypothetical protein